MQHKNIINIIWSAVESLSSQSIQLIVGIIIARIILPSDYGLIGMITIFISFSQVFVDSGFSNALIQKTNRNETDFSTIFYFNIFTSIFIYIILYFISPVISSFYYKPILKDICRILCTIIIINGFCLVQKTKYVIKGDFKSIAKFSSITSLLSGLLGIIFAYYGFGVWALVIQQIFYSIIYAIFLTLDLKWRPLIIFSRQSFKQLFNFGYKLTIGGILHTVYINLYSVIIGKYYNANQVGYYTRSDSFSKFPSLGITAIIDRAVYPILCTYQDDIEKLKMNFNKIIRFSVFIVFPLMAILSILSDSFLNVVLSSKWIAASPFLSILCYGYMLFPIMDFNWQILNVMGRSDLSLKSEILKKIVAIAFLMCSICFGIKAICWSFVLSCVADTLISSFYVNKILKINIINELELILPVVLNTGAMAIILYVFKTNIIMPNFLLLICGSFLGITIYLAIAYIFRFNEINYIKQIYNERFNCRRL